MNDETSTIKGLSDDLKAAFDWWREAGVDHDFSGEPVDRLAEAAAEHEAAKKPKETIEQERKPAPAAPVRSYSPQAGAGLGQLGGERESWPQTLDAFAGWWTGDASLAALGNDRLAPRGIAGADLMVIVAQPEGEDRGKLLSAQHGALVAAFLRAAGLEEDRCYFASALPAPLAMPDWPALAQAGLGNVLGHHIALAAPRRILALGRNILPLLGHDQAQGTAQLAVTGGESGVVPVMAAPGPEELLRSGHRRKRLWNDWLEWTG